MKRLLVALFFSVALVTQAAENITAYFSPRGGCTDAVVRELGKAKTNVFVAAYGFTNAKIAEAIKKARSRGIKVQILLDDSNQTDKYSAATFLQNAGIAPLVDSKHAIFHNKFMVIDGRTLITGSFNFTTAAEEKNAENLLVIRDAELCAEFLVNWKEHAKHAKSYARKESKGSR